jgi:cytochrome c biogenesis factor
MVSMTPNLDRYGRMVRAVCGALLVGVGVGQAFFFARPWRIFHWMALLIPVALGAFMLYEARKGWCALRACGLKTPL